jgi:hypothetical protein
MLSEAIILELKEIIEQEYGRELSLAEASEVANTLVGYFDLLTKIHHRDQINDNENEITTGNITEPIE